MTLEEKIEQLQKSSMEDARSHANEMIDEYKKQLEQIYDEHKETVEAQSEGQIKAEADHAKQELNKAMSKSQLDLKHKLNQYQTDLKNQLFEEVDALVADYMNTPEYTALLKKHISEALEFAKGEAITIYINPSDKDKLADLESETNAKLTVSAEDFTGGMRAVIRERNVLIDHSFKGALSEVRNTFQFRGGTDL